MFHPMHTGHNLLIGLGGHLEQDTNLPFSERLDRLKAELHGIDPDASIDFLDGVPARDGDSVTALDHGMPYLTFLDLFIVGGSETWPDALTSMYNCMEKAKKVGSYIRLDMQINGDSHEPSISQLVDFFRRAWDMTDPMGIDICVETHIDRVSYDPRHVMRIHEALLDATKGERGLLISADFSHYIHQVGNTHGLHWQDISSGALNLDPFDPENYVSKVLIPSGLIKMGHLRMAVPNNLDRTQGSIQYPIIDPAKDPTPTGYDGLWHYGAFDESRTEPWKAWYRELFRAILSSDDPTPITFNTEFIRYDGDYAQEPYRNQYQNLAMVAWAQRTKREILAELNG
jgi:hypothetical protein